MVPPLLKLLFVQGPRDGESLEYKPGSTIRIGRIVRGNEITVKDAGVSGGEEEQLQGSGRDEERYKEQADWNRMFGVGRECKVSHVVEEMEARNEDVEDEKGCSETSDNEDERVEQVEIESRKREDMYCSVGEDGEAENLQDLIDKERDCKSEEAVTDTSDEKAEEGYRNEEKVDLEKIALGDWFKYMEVHLRRKMVDETEEMIEAMRAKSQRVHQHIAEQKQAK
ncbi:hypothetical protein Bca4012_086161 [Brassica carinata]